MGPRHRPRRAPGNPRRHLRWILRATARHLTFEMTSEGRLKVGDRTIAYLEADDPDGALVLHDHGGPSSRLEALDTLVPEVINKTVAQDPGGRLASGRGRRALHRCQPREPDPRRGS